MDKKEETGSKISYYFGSMIIIFILTFFMTYRKYMGGSDFKPHADMALALNRHIGAICIWRLFHVLFGAGYFMKVLAPHTT